MGFDPPHLQTIPARERCHRSGPKANSNQRQLFLIATKAARVSVSYMKTLVFFLVMLGTIALHAQESVSPDKWKLQNDESLHLAFLLFPDFLKSDSTLTQEYKLCLPSSSLYPRLANDSFLPLFTVFQAAQYLGIQPKWGALKDSEKLETVGQLTYFSGLLIRVIHQQNQLIASYQQRIPNNGVSMVTPQGFIPEAMQNISAREAFGAHPSPSATDSQPTQGNGAPPAPVPLPPLTTTVIDPQTGDVQVIVH